MKLASWIYYLLDRRIGNPIRFNRLYSLDRDPFGCEVYPYEKEKADKVIALLRGKHFSHVLDIGCGSGTLTKRISAFAESVTAIDFSVEAIKIARSKNDTPSSVRFEQADIRNFSLSDTYDLIVCSEVLYYLTPVELTSFVDKLVADQKSGTLLVAVGKLDDSRVREILLKRLQQINRIKGENNRRPYAVDLYQFH